MRYLKTILILAALTAALAGCHSVQRLPMPTPAERPPAPAQEDSEPVPRSALLSPPKLSAMAKSLLPGCERYGLVSAAGSEVLLGYEKKDSTNPTRLASLSRIGDRSGNMVVGVGVQKTSGGTRVSAAETASPSGTLEGWEKWQQRKDGFLNQFAGRATTEKLKDVDAITGATGISKALRKVVRQEARRLDDLLEDPHRLKALSARAGATGSTASQPFAAGPPQGDGVQTGGALAGGDLFSTVTGKGSGDLSIQQIAFLSELVLFGAMVSLVVWGELRRRRN